MGSAVDAARAVEAMKGFLGVVELAQLGVAVEPLVQLETLPEVEGEAVAEQETADGGMSVGRRRRPCAAG